MKKIFLGVITALIIGSCNEPQHSSISKSVNVDSVKNVLMQTDKAFSDFSKAKGRNASFLEYMDQHVTMMRANGMPLPGHQQ